MPRSYSWEKISLQQIVLGQLDSYFAKKWNWTLTLLIPYGKIITKCIEILSVRAETIQVLENIKANLCDLGFGNGFLDTKQKAQAITEKKNR